jgi:hypothetical protein
MRDLGRRHHQDRCAHSSAGKYALLTDLVDPVLPTGFPAGTRLICRRERPHPGAPLSRFDTIAGMRHQVFATDTPHGGNPIQYLGVRHRTHARVEDRIRMGKSTGRRPDRSNPAYGRRHLLPITRTTAATLPRSPPEPIHRV